MEVSILLESVAARLDTLSKAKNAFRKTMSPDFNPLLVLGLGENRMSTAIGYLLDPNETHGQGQTYLRIFMDQVDLHWEFDSRHITVKTEALTDRIETSNRRIDILVEAQNSFAFAIENKFWAIDQNYQLEHYARHLSHLNPANRCMIYLTPHGIEPSAKSISAEDFKLEFDNNRLRVLSYDNDILKWLDVCRQVTQAPRVWSFLQDLSQYIELTFIGVTDVTQNEVVAASTRSSEALSAALKIAFAADAIKAELLKQLKEQLEQGLTKGDLEWHMNDWSKYAGLAIPHPRLPQLQFRLEFQSGRLNWLMMGISMSDGFDERSLNLVAIRKTFTEQIGKNEGNERWITCHQVAPKNPALPIESNWNTAERPWNLILSGELAKMILSARDKMFALLDAKPA